MAKDKIIALRLRINALKEKIDTYGRKSKSLYYMRHVEDRNKPNVNTSSMSPLQLSNISAVARQEKLNLLADTLLDIPGKNRDV
jgi:hypothetical protein